MRELSFRGFLSQYVKELSFSGTNSIRVLASEADKQNPRLREPLLLYSLMTNKADFLTKNCGDRLRLLYGDLLTCDASSVIDLLRDDRLGENYQKVWRSYLSVRDRHKTDNWTKALMRQNIIRVKNEKSISTYRIYRDLRLNGGNLNAWLKHGDDDKVSLSTARKVYRYVQKMTCI